MKVVIDIANDEELKKIAKILKGRRIKKVNTVKDRKKALEQIFNTYNVKLPKDYKFNREEIHAR